MHFKIINADGEVHLYPKGSVNVLTRSLCGKETVHYKDAVWTEKEVNLRVNCHECSEVTDAHEIW